MKQTAVQWLQQTLECFGNKHELQMSWDTLNDLVEQAKEMEKEQVIKFTNDYLDDDADLSAEEYYNETFKSE